MVVIYLVSQVNLFAISTIMYFADNVIIFQIADIEKMYEQSQPLDNDQMAKMHRRSQIEIRLEEIEEALNQLSNE